MYVDDSGSSRHMDHTDYFILSGIIVEDDKIKNLQKAVFEYNQSNFTGNFIDAEIHTYDIYKKRGNFSLADHATRVNPLDKLYEMISSLDCTGIISVVYVFTSCLEKQGTFAKCIKFVPELENFSNHMNKYSVANKKELQINHPTWDIFTVSWSFLLEGYDRYLKENSIKHGKIVIDKSSSKTQHDIIRTIDRLRSWGKKYQRISQITKSVFVDSAGVYGIQIADAFAYCALQHNKKNKGFDKYWNIIYGKLEKNSLNIISDHEYKKYQ